MHQRAASANREVRSRFARLGQMLEVQTRKQVGDAYLVTGNPLWRAAVAEMRLVLENRLGLAPKK